MTYPVKFRKKLISVIEKLKIEEAAIRFDVGSASVSRWKVNPEPKLTRNRPAQKIDMEALKINPDSFIYERAERFSVSNSGRRYALKRLGISRKKNTAERLPSTKCNLQTSN